MHRLVLLMVALGSIVVGCDQADPVEKQEKQAGVEQVQKEKPEVEELSLQEQVDKYCDPDTPMYKQGPKCSEAVAKLQTAAAEKMEEQNSKPLTLESYNELNNEGRMGDQENAALLECQAQKYADEHGVKATKQHVGELISGLLLGDYMDDKHKDKFDKQIIRNLQNDGVEPIYATEEDDSVQAQLIEEGYTCSLTEVYDRQASAASASASANAAMEKEMERLQQSDGE